MRQLVMILAIFGFLAAPPILANEDPFDFTSPLPTTSAQRRTAQYFSRTAGPAESNDEESAKDADAPSRFLRERSETSVVRERSETSADRPKNYAADLFEEARKAATEERPPTVSFSKEIARQRQSASERQPVDEHNPQEALRRFDEFLKTHDVSSADYSQPADHEERSTIRQVQGQQGEAPFDDLPSFGDLDTLPGEEPSSEPSRTGQPRNPLFELQQSSEIQPSPEVRPKHQDRLTDPIPTDSPFGKPPASPFGKPPARESNPFAAESAPMPPSREERPVVARQPVLEPKDLKPKDFGSIPAMPEEYHSTTTRPHSVDSESAASPSVVTSWTLLSPLNLGQECMAELVVTNTGEETAERVSLEVRLPDSVQVVDAVPVPIEQRAFLGWKFTELAAGESRTIQIAFVASAAGPLDLSAHVRHTSSRRESFTVSQPQLDVAVSGATEVHVGEPASQTVIVRNPGTGIATNVKLQATIPAGLEHAQGKRLLMDIGSLNPGEVRSVRLAMGAAAGGKHVVQVQANADAGLIQTAAAEVTVIAPSLKAGIDGPSLRYLGREAEYAIRVLNDGSAPTDFVQVNHRIPEGFGFVSAGRGAKFDPVTRLLNWYVGALGSNESQDLKIKLIASHTGEFVHEVRATSEHGAQADARLTTRVEGAASLVLKVADLDDPVEVGSETAYEITIINEGTASAHTVGLMCEIPRGLSFVDAKGPSNHRVEAEMIGFRPISELPAGQSLTYRVHVQGEVAGDLRFRCQLSSESLSQPLFTEELTKFYAE